MIFPKLTIRDVDINNKVVLVRVDYNLLLDDAGKIVSDFRLQASLPTLKGLINANCKIILMAHLGRPGGRVDKNLSLQPVASHLSEVLNKEVVFIDDYNWMNITNVVDSCDYGDIIMLENLRFNPEEEADDLEFAKHLADSTRADYFIQEGFGVVHRMHASTDAITKFLPSVAGLLVKKEYDFLKNYLADPKRPFVLIIGGAKIADKLPVIKKLIEFSDRIIIGGAIANTFLRYHGKNIGKSVYESDQEAVISEIYHLVDQKIANLNMTRDDFLILPEDVRVAKTMSENSRSQTVSVDEVGDDDIILDIGDESVDSLVSQVKSAQTVFWNGTLGYTDIEQFSIGSQSLAKTLASSDIRSIIGGGDTVGFITSRSEFDPERDFTHVSTGGGASIDLIAGKKLPGVESLLDAQDKK
ncbi:phosphoglycerate kinase [Candidatus Saccharibacteria bacterium]|nr:MAG: phosphoglycerate kinase [Candidatus Saccharibacteria bacterium]